MIFQIGHHKWTVGAHLSCIAFHDIERSTDIWRQVDFVDDEQIALRDSGAPFAGDFVPFSHVDHEDVGVGELPRETRRQVIAAGLDDDHLELGELPLDAHIREEADGGRPTVAAAPDSARAKAYFEMARRTAGALAVRARDRSSVFPRIVVEES